MVPQPNYLASASFGSLELRQSSNNEFIGQQIDYSEGKLRPVQAITIDSLKFARVDFIKIDVEGMEMEALAGAAQSFIRNKPALLIEAIKAGPTTVGEWLIARGYKVFPASMNIFAVHVSGPILSHIRTDQPHQKSHQAPAR